MRTLALALLVTAVALADTSGPPRAIIETRWSEGDVVATGNDTWDVCERAGDVLVARIAGRGEAALVRRKRYPLSLPCSVTFRIRWTEAALESAYPSVHIVFDPPVETDKAWWERASGGGWGAEAWSGERSSFLFHFPDRSSGWAQYGITRSLQEAPHRHEFAPPKNAWIRLEIRLERGRVVVRADGKQVAACDADLSSHKYFTWAFGDQTSTRVEVDEVRIGR